MSTSSLFSLSGLYSAPDILYIALAGVPSAVQEECSDCFLTGRLGDVILSPSDCVVAVSRPSSCPKPSKKPKEGKRAYFHLAQPLNSPLYALRVFGVAFGQFETIHSCQGQTYPPEKGVVLCVPSNPSFQSMVVALTRVTFVSQLVLVDVDPNLFLSLAPPASVLSNNQLITQLEIKQCETFSAAFPSLQNCPSVVAQITGLQNFITSRLTALLAAQQQLMQKAAFLGNSTHPLRVSAAVQKQPTLRSVVKSNLSTYKYIYLQYLSL